MPLHPSHNNTDKCHDDNFSQLWNPGSPSVPSESIIRQGCWSVRSTRQEQDNSENWNCRIQGLITELRQPSTDETTSRRDRIEEDLVDAWLSGLLLSVPPVEENADAFMDAAHDSIEITKRRRQTFPKKEGDTICLMLE